MKHQQKSNANSFQSRTDYTTDRTNDFCAVSQNFNGSLRRFPSSFLVARAGSLLVGAFTKEVLAAAVYQYL